MTAQNGAVKQKTSATDTSGVNPTAGSLNEPIVMDSSHQKALRTEKSKLGTNQLKLNIPQINLDDQLDYQHLNPASFGQRASAYVIDILLSLASVQLISLLLAKLAISISPFLLQWLVPLIYFVGSQLIYQGTPGKLLLKLRIVSEDTNHLSLMQLLGRETIGRTISGLPFLMGYLYVLISPEKMAWHDRLSRTRVVSLSPASETHARQVAIIFGCLGILLLVFLGVGYYSLAYTPLPLRTIAKSMKAQGYRIEGIGGSFKKGFEVDLLAFENAEIQYEMKNVSFEVSVLENLKGFDRIFQLDRLTVLEGFVKIKKFGSNSQQLKTEEQLGQIGEPGNPKSIAPKVPSFIMKDSQKVAVSVVLVDLNNLKFEVPIAKEAFLLKRVHLSNVFASEHQIQLERFFVDSGQFGIDLKQFEYKANQIFMQQASYVTIKKELIPDYLRNDLSLAIKVSGGLHDKVPERIEIAIADRLKVLLTPIDFNLDLQNFDPRVWLKQPLPMTRIDLSLRMPGFVNGKSLFPPKFVGRVFIGASEFTLKPIKGIQELMMGLEGIHVRGAEQFKIKVMPNLLLLSKDSKSALGPKKLLNFALEGPARDSMEDNLALLYFGRNYWNINQIEKDQITYQRTLFDVGGNLLESNPQLTQPDQMTPANRMPAQNNPAQAPSK